MAKNIVKQIGNVYKDEAGEFAKLTRETVADSLKQAKEVAVSSVTGIEIKDSEQSQAELEQLKKIGEQKEKAKAGEFPELRRILEQQKNEKAFIDQEKQMKQQMTSGEAQRIVEARQKKMGSSLNPLNAVGQKLTGMKALMFKTNKKETKQQ